MRQGLCAAAALATAVVVTPTTTARAEQNRTVPGLFFGAGGGLGIAAISRSGAGSEGGVGGVLEAVFGWNVGTQFSVGGEVTTWQSSFTDTPVSLHAIGSRFEWVPPREDRIRLSAMVGLGITDGDRDPGRVGGALSLGGAYQVPLVHGAAFAAEVSFQTQMYSDGWAVMPTLGVSLRFNGAVPE
jgi:hypothetical protein